MDQFKKKIAYRIAIVSTALAVVFGIVSYFIQVKNGEQYIASLAIDSAQRIINHNNLIDYEKKSIDEKNIDLTVENLINYGNFDNAEIYDAKWHKLAEADTNEAAAFHPQFIGENHNLPYQEPAYFSKKANDGRRFLNIFIPIRDKVKDKATPVFGYLELLHIVPEWREKELYYSALSSFFIVALAALICGATLYPIIIFLNREKERKSEQILKSYIFMMTSLGEAVSKRDSGTGLHNYRVTWLAIMLAEAIKYPPAKMPSLIVGSLLHDVGKLAIPDSILLKEGSLDPEEMAIMRTHVQHGEDIVKNLGWLEGASDVISNHHEKWNGSGYPHQKKEEYIPLSARIFSVVDVFDALCSERPYKEKLKFETAMSIMEKDIGTHFDPSIMQIFKTIAKRCYDQMTEASEAEIHALFNERVNYYFQSQLV